MCTLHTYFDVYLTFSYIASTPLQQSGPVTIRSFAVSLVFSGVLQIRGWHRPLMVRILGGPLRLHKRAANNIFSGWISLNRYEPPAIIEKKLHNFFEMNEPLGGNKSE